MGIVRGTGAGVFIGNLWRAGMTTAATRFDTVVNFGWVTATKATPHWPLTRTRCKT